MARQNRVDPFGKLIATSARGTLMGNRGCLHDAAGKVVRRWTTKAWIACVLDFKGRHRAIMTPGKYTELFFLDEATALAAGHRPCAECRRADYKRFKAAWIAANDQYLFGPDVAIDNIDAVIHHDRASRPYEADLAKLPDGVFIAEGESAWLLRNGKMLRWSPEGYGEARPRPAAGFVITPRSVVAALGAGYAPRVHASASACAAPRP